MPGSSPSAGFTLVELMITLAIVAILAAIAVPLYSKQVQKSRRVDARTGVLDIAGREERFLSTSGSYATTWAQLGYTAAGNTTAALPVASGYYQIVVVPVAGVAATNTPPSYTITATAIGQQLKDITCRTFVVTSTGSQTAADSGGADTSTTCWQ